MGLSNSSGVWVLGVIDYLEGLTMHTVLFLIASLQEFKTNEETEKHSLDI